MVKVSISCTKTSDRIRIQRVEKHTKMTFSDKKFFGKFLTKKSDYRLRCQ